MFHNHLNDPSIKEIQEGIQRQLDALGKTPYDLLHDCKSFYQRFIWFLGLCHELKP